MYYTQNFYWNNQEKENSSNSWWGSYLWSMQWMLETDMKNIAKVELIGLDNWFDFEAVGGDGV